MNDRIKQLADEAAKFSAILALPTGESGDKLFVEKFAQLIVQECVSVINTEAGEREDDDEYERAWKMGTEFAVYQIKQHFGVEE